MCPPESRDAPSPLWQRATRAFLPTSCPQDPTTTTPIAIPSSTSSSSTSSPSSSFSDAMTPPERPRALSLTYSSEAAAVPAAPASSSAPKSGSTLSDMLRSMFPSRLGHRDLNVLAPTSL